MDLKLKKVLVSDPVDASCAELLTRHGISVTTKYKLSKEALIRELQDHDALIVRSETKVTADIISAAPKLRVIGRAGTGVDNIDVSAATNQGVLVLNTPGGNSISACELTCALISALARNVVQAAQSLKEGRWDRKLYAGRELSGKVLGVLGAGRIGCEVAKRMMSYGMKVIAFDPLLTEELAKTLQITKGSLDDVWKNADYITVHTPLIPQTKNLINAETLAKCKKGVRIVNVARGGIVDEEALLKSIKDDHCGGAALDVFIEEPPKSPVTLELISHPKVVATPHLGASTSEAQERVAVEIAEQFIGLTDKSGKYSVTGVVNAPSIVASTKEANVPWVDLAKKLGVLMQKYLPYFPEMQIEAVGDALKDKKDVLQTAALVGVLSVHATTEINMINAAVIAEKEKIKVNAKCTDGSEPALIIRVEAHELKGTIINNKPVLLSIDKTEMGNGVNLQNKVAFYPCNRLEEIIRVVDVITREKFEGTMIIKGNWVALESSEIFFIPVPDIESF